MGLMMVKRINLALQGGGSHGAFSWGVLDRLLDEEGLEISAISGTSAGALNGAALKAGLAVGPGPEGRAAARENLAHVWSQVSQVSNSSAVRWMYSMLPKSDGLQRWGELFSPMAWAEGVGRLISPYDFGPLYTNPLASVIRNMPHPVLDSPAGPEFFVSATNVKTGRIRVFSNHEITPETIMASACLPTVFKAVQITDPATGHEEIYWDGGYSGNPALFPLYKDSLPRDIVIVNINPMYKEGVPRTPGDIQERINEISFNAAMLGELRAISFVKRLYDEKRLEGRPMKNVLLHMIGNDELMGTLGASTKILPSPGLVNQLFKAGREAASAFMAEDAEAIGKRDSYDPRALLEEAVPLA